MGIQGLHLALKPYTESKNIQDFAGSSVAVDTSSWLHKSVYSIADHYVECLEHNSGTGGRVDARCCHVASTYIVKRCSELLQYAAISKIYLVMDGKRCPLKAATNQEREKRRAENLAAARKYRQQGRNDLMYEKYKSCIKVTDQLTHEVAKIIRTTFSEQKVEIIWSPYEADAELVQLVADGRVTAVITEDSDVLVYSASTQLSFPILYKLDRNTGACEVLSMDWLLDPNYVKQPPIPTQQDKPNEITQLQLVLDILVSRQRRRPGWGSRLFVQACILAGCDYAPRQLNGVGLVTAFKYVRTAGLTGSTASLAKVFRSILYTLLPKKTMHAVHDLQALEELLAQSEAVFYYHPVINSSNQIVHLNQIPTSDNDTTSFHHAPILHRFVKTDFLGSLVAHQNFSDIIPHQVLKQQQIQTVDDTVHISPEPCSSTFKTSQPILKQNVNDTNPEAHHQCRIPSQPQCPKSKVLVNPYQKLDAFQIYHKRHAEGGVERVNKIVTAQLPASSRSIRKEPLRPLMNVFQYKQRDIRFVKRNFPMDGSKAPIPSPEKLLASKHINSQGQIDQDNCTHTRILATLETQSNVQRQKIRSTPSDKNRPSANIVSAFFSNHRPKSNIHHNIDKSYNKKSWRENNERTESNECPLTNENNSDENQSVFCKLDVDQSIQNPTNEVLKNNDESMLSKDQTSSFFRRRVTLEKSVATTKGNITSCPFDFYDTFSPVIHPGPISIENTFTVQNKDDEMSKGKDVMSLQQPHSKVTLKSLFTRTTMKRKFSLRSNNKKNFVKQLISSKRTKTNSSIRKLGMVQSHHKSILSHFAAPRHP